MSFPVLCALCEADQALPGEDLCAECLADHAPSAPLRSAPAEEPKAKVLARAALASMRERKERGA